MSATIHNPGIKNNNSTVIPFRKLNGDMYIRFDYCTSRHEEFITINNVVYYKMKTVKKHTKRRVKKAPIMIR
jgi:hypothetical protein